MPEPKQPRMPGFPGTPDEDMQKRQRLVKAFQQLHAALLEHYEASPEGTVITLARKIKGHVIKVAFRVGAQEEAEEMPTPRITLNNQEGEKPNESSSVLPRLNP